jgi:hypothetical protein
MSGKYDVGWKRYKLWRNLGIVGWLGFFPFVIAAGALTRRFFHSPIFFSVAAVAWLILMAYACGEAAYWRCPRCGKPFAATWWYRLGPFARRCAHCGLPKYSDG